MSFATELAAASRTPQQILELGVIQCMNWYNQIVQADSLASDDFSHVTLWIRSGVTVTANVVTAPDGTLTADRLDFAAINDYEHNFASSFTAASKAFTQSCFLKSVSGSGTITLRLEDGGATESREVQISLTATAWVRGTNHILFTGAAVGGVRWRIIRRAGDLASVYAWRANTSPNPVVSDAEMLFPGVLTNGFVANASSCAAADAGGTSRCFYSFATCQDLAHFNPGASYEPDSCNGIKKLKFCRQDAPLPVGGADIWPLLKSIDVTPVKIVPDKAVTESEVVNAVFYDAPATWNWNQDKASAGAKTNPAGLSGSFWRRFMRIYRNYANPRGYAKLYAAMIASGLTESDFQVRGKYLVNNLKIDGRGMVTLRLTDRMKLLKTKALAKISDNNLINGAVSSGAVSIAVDDATELTAPAVNAATAAPDYIVTIMIDSEFFNVTGRSGNVLTVQPGRWGSSQASHPDNSAWKEVLMLGTERSTPSLAPLGKNVIDIVIELLYRAGLTTADIDIATLQSERDLWLPSAIDPAAGTQSGVTFQRAGATIDVGNGGISAQQEIEKLLGSTPPGQNQGKVIGGIRAAAMLDLWVGESLMVTGRAFAPARPTVTLAEFTDANDLLKDSIEIDDNEQSRVTRIVIAYDLAAGKNGDSVSDYQRFIVEVGSNEEADGDFGTQRTLTILSPWIRGGDASTAKRLAKHLFARYRQPARLINFALELRGDGNKTGDFAYISTAALQAPDGLTDSQRIIALMSKKWEAGRIMFEAQDVSVPLGRRYGFICPDGYPDYDAATTEQRRRAFIADSNATVGVKGDPAYFIW